MYSEIYNRVSHSYNSNKYDEKYREGRVLSPCEIIMLDKFTHNMGTNVLSVGCGSASIFEPYLVNQGFEVSGIDLSVRQINKARIKLPMCNFWVGNFLDVNVSKQLYDGILCMYALFNFIEDDQRTALQKMFDLLKSGGHALINIRYEISKGIKYDSSWCGDEMYWYLPGVNQVKQWCEEIGFNTVLYPNTDNKDYVFFLLEKK